MLNSPIEEIKNRLDIAEVIGSYLKLKKAGANYRANCPFHSEKTPSFFVSPARQIWHCFGCGAGTSLFDFIMKIEGVEFGDALRILAQRAGVELKPTHPELKTKRQRLYDICELAVRFFEKQLENSAGGKESKEFLLKRGLKPESIKKWRVGYAPDVWQGLSDFLVGKGYAREEIVRAGLAIESEKGKNPYDRFRGRIMFPVFDLSSQAIGFGGRITEKNKEEGTAKYINSPGTLLYDKSRVLYGLNSARVAIRKQNQCVLTEGYTDVILSHQAGFENTVAASGTALTQFQLNILKRYSENLLLAFDMDIAGDNATKRGIDLAQELGFNIKTAKLPQGLDPADIISKNPQDWEKVVKEARSILDFYFDSAFSAHNKGTPEGKKEIGKIVLPVIKRIPNKIEQSHWIQRLAKELSVREEDVFEELKKVKISSNFSFSGADAKEEAPENFSQTAVFAGEQSSSPDFLKFSEGRKKVLEEKILSLIVKSPQTVSFVSSDHLLFFSELSKKIVGSFVNKPQNEIPAVFSSLQNEASGELKNFLAALSLRVEVGVDENPQEEIKLCLSELKCLEVKNQLKEIAENLKRAEEADNQNQINILMEKFNKLSRELA